MTSSTPIRLHYLHGLGSAGNSQTAAALTHALGDAVDVTAPSYPAHEVDPTLRILEEIHDEIAPEVVVGTSLGGYWAIRYGERYPEARILAINPTLNPLLTLARRGTSGFTDYTTGDTVAFTEAMRTAFRPVSAPRLATGQVDLTLVRGLEDDVIPIDLQRDMARDLNLEDVPAHEFEMGHRADPEKILPLVKGLIDRCHKRQET